MASMSAAQRGSPMQQVGQPAPVVTASNSVMQNKSPTGEQPVHPPKLQRISPGNGLTSMEDAQVSME